MANHNCLKGIKCPHGDKRSPRCSPARRSFFYSGALLSANDQAFPHRLQE